MEVPGLRLQLGGGIRTAAQISAALELGAARVMVGTLAAAEPDLVGRIAAETGRVVVALDCRDGRVRTHGWIEDTGTEAAAFVTRLANAGARDFLVTGIDRDGTGRGPDLELIAERARPGARASAERGRRRLGGGCRRGGRGRRGCGRDRARARGRHPHLRMNIRESV